MSPAQGAPATPPAIPRVRRLHLVVVLAALAMFGPFTTDSIFPGFESIGRQFGVDSTAMQQVTSVYLLAFAVMSLLHGPLSDAIGRRPVMIGGTILYALASVGCALAPNLGVLLFFRALQGLFAGSGTIVSRAVIRDLYDGPQAQRLMSQIAMIFGLAPAIAPVTGGALLTIGPWPVLFWTLVIYGLAMSGSAATLPETHPEQRRTPLRIGSLAASLWSVARDPRFLRITFGGALGFSGQFLYIACAPIFVVHLLHRGAQDFWLLFVPMIAGMITGSFTVGRLAGRLSGFRVATLGFAIATGGGVVNIVSVYAWGERLPAPLLGPMLVALGAALVYPITQLSQLDLFPTRRGAAASVGMFLSLLMNTALAAVGWVVTGSLLTMAAASLALILLGWVLWLWHGMTGGTIAPPPARPEAYEPTDEM